MKNRISLLVLLTLSVSCGSTMKKAPGDKVLGRIDDLESRPKWFNESEDVQEHGDKLIFWGRTTLKRGERVEIGYRISELNAKSKIASYVSEKISSITQTADEVSEADSTLFRGIITQKAKVRLSEIKSGKRYWEKVLTVDAHGDEQIEHRVFQSVEIKKSDLAKLVREALEQGKHKLSEDFTKKVEAEWDKIDEG